MDKIKDFVIVIASSLLGFFHPIGDFVLAILVLILVNFCSGLIEDELHADGWKWKKAWSLHLTTYFRLGILPV